MKIQVIAEVAYPATVTEFIYELEQLPPDATITGFDRFSSPPNKDGRDILRVFWNEER